MKKYLLSMMIFCSLGWSILGSSVFSSTYQANILEKKVKKQAKIVDEAPPTKLDDLQKADDEQLNYWANSLEKFDGREFNYITPTRNQYNKNTCWVYAAVGIAETNILRKGIDKEATTENLDFDETIASYNRHTRDGSQDPLFLTTNDTYYYGHWNQGDSGSPNALSIMTQGYTLLDENHFHSSVSNSEIESKLKQSKYYVKSYQNIDNDKESIKRAILKYGGVTFNYSAPSSYIYFNDTAQSNHTSFIIGWDDTIKTSSFSPKHPNNDGAWIIKNSWGDDFYKKNMINNTTAYYISYEQPIGGLYSIDMAMKEDYQNIYYYDGNVSIHMNKSGGEAQGAIYEAKLSTTTKQEQLKAVMIYTPEDDLNVNVKIYKNLKVNPNNIYDSMNIPEQNSPVIDMNTHVNNTGMHTIDLDNPLNLNQGEFYSVVVRCKTKSSASVSIRCAQDNSASTNDMTYFLENGKWTNFKSTDNRTAKIRAITNLVERKVDSENINDLQFARVEIKDRIVNYEKDKDLIPEVQVYLEDKLLKKDQDYTLKVQEIKSPGLATLEIIGINNYKGTKTTTFEIKKANIPPGAINGTLTVYNDTAYLYDIPIPHDWTWIDENKKLEYGITNNPVSLKYIGNDKDFYEIITCEFYINKLDQDFPDSIHINNATIKILDNYTYTGEQIIPNIQITYENNLLYEGIDYLLTYKNNIDAGLGEVFIKGKGHFCNEVSKTFAIQKADYPKEIPNSVINVNYKVTNLNQITLNYENWIWENQNQEITSDTFKANAIYIGNDSHNYINTKVEITIIKEKPEISSITELKLDVESFVYDGEEKTPTIIAQDGTYTLIKDIDYKIEYQNNINAGVATIIIQGINNYKGTKKLNFTISKAEKPNVDTTIHQEGNVSNLSDICLPEGFIWEDESVEIIGNKMVAKAIYLGDDASNYETTELTFEIILEEPFLNQKNHANLIIWVVVPLVSLAIVTLSFIFVKYRNKVKN